MDWVGVLLGAGAVVCVIGIAHAQFMLVRNRWVYRVRTELIDRDFAAYLRMDSYQEMMRRFWVWDVREFMH